MINVGVVGGTGYTGAELLRLLVNHPEVQLKSVTSRSEAGLAVSELFPSLRGFTEITFTEPDIANLAQNDLVFFATPNGTAMNMVPELVKAGVRVIDLAADFRLRRPADWEHWYGMPHACEDILAEAVYGLPELNRSQIKEARVIANPGCYPTAVTLGLLPLLENDLINEQHIIADAKSGVSGAGRGARVDNLLCEVSESFKAYAVNGHRHLPEIRQTLGIAAKKDIDLTFVPHLVPMVRGIEATLYGVLKSSSIDLQALYEQRYEEEYFVDVLPAGTVPETRSVRGTNICRMAVFRPQGGDTVVISSVIDNLAKGAAGQAVQNLNIMFNFSETTGLTQPGLLP